MTKMRITYLHVRKPISVVALYDRASTIRQSNNYIRGYYKDLAADCCKQNGWRLQGCYLDVGSGERTNNRGQLDTIVFNDEIDTVAICAIDRLARGTRVSDELEHKTISRGKNLILIEDDDSARVFDSFYLDMVGIFSKYKDSMVLDLDEDEQTL